MPPKLPIFGKICQNRNSVSDGSWLHKISFGGFCSQKNFYCIFHFLPGGYNLPLRGRVCSWGLFFWIACHHAELLTKSNAGNAIKSFCKYHSFLQNMRLVSHFLASYLLHLPCPLILVHCNFASYVKDAILKSSYPSACSLIQEWQFLPSLPATKFSPDSDQCWDYFRNLQTSDADCGECV